MRKVVSAIFFWGFIVLTIAFFFGLLSTLVNPNQIWIFSFFGLAFPIIMLVILFYFLYWLFTKNKKMMYPLILFCLSVISVPNFFNWQILRKTQNVDDSIKVLSYNVHNFGAYNQKRGEETKEDILHFIEEQQADIVCLQEVFDSPKFINVKQELTKLSYPYIHFEVGAKNKADAQFGILIASKFPIQDVERISFKSGGNLATKAVLDIDSTQVAIFNMHLQSAHIDTSYYNYTAEEISSLNQESVTFRMRRLKYQLKTAFMKRADQAKQVHQVVKKSDQAVILCGDFNDTPVSFAYTKVKGNLSDSFKKGRFGLGVSYAPLPFLRIDHIFSSDELEALSHKVVKINYSDHYPVLATFQWKEN